MEVIWILIAVGIGWALYRYFTGHGGIRISRAKLGGLPLKGELVVRGHEIRWTATDADSFAAAWPTSSGVFVAIRVLFKGALDDPDGEGADFDPEEDRDQGRLDVTVGDRQVVDGVEWTEEILDRGLRSDVEMVLKALARRAEQSRAAANSGVGAKPVGTPRELE